jgi:Xaa-Pro aminopeptidase
MTVGTQSERLGALRKQLTDQGLDGFIVPRTDEHQGEYVPAHADRLSWLTGFSGSAGNAVILQDKAALFVDGRYTLQVRNETDGDLYNFPHFTDEPLAEWTTKHIPAGKKLGYDPWLHTPHQVTRFKNACANADAKLVACLANPIDAIWADQPLPPVSPAVPLEITYTGRTSKDKREGLAKKLHSKKLDATILAAPDSIAWLLNMRGNDVPYSPLVLCFALVHNNGNVDLFINQRKITDDLAASFDDGIKILDRKNIETALNVLGQSNKSVSLDPNGAPSWIQDRLNQAGAQVVFADDPCQLPKAIKNSIEINGIRAAHQRDGAALTQFLAWLSKAVNQGRVTEISAADKLEEFRSQDANFRSLSFTTISGAGPNGAIVHYRVTAESNSPLENGSLYLVDSGAQYPDGTTDVTRTIAIGTPSEEMRNRFTLVLKGHIALACAKFPKGTTGSQLDPLARRALWAAGLDFEHGTGHGVWHYLSVHEGPQRISKMGNTVALLPGMVISNEPGYYKTGAYGIRIENLQTVIPIDAPTGSEQELLGFEVLTLAPIDLALVDASILSADEISWLNDYHTRVRMEISPIVDTQTRAWIEMATQSIN